MTGDLHPLLVEALSSRLGSTADPALHALLASNYSNQPGALPSTQELLSQLESTNPTLGWIAKYLTALRASESETVIEAEPDARAETLQVEEDEHLAEVVQRLERHVKKLRAEVVQLRERNDNLATALGACYLCWGDDPGCPVCRGTGRPGSRMFDRQSFAQLVAPALKALKAPKEVNLQNSDSGQSNGSLQEIRTLKGEQNE